MILSIKRCLTILYLLLAYVNITNAQVMHITGNVYKNMKSFDGVKPIKFLSPFPFIYSTTETKPTNRLQHIKVKAKTLVKRLQLKAMQP